MSTKFNIGDFVVATKDGMDYYGGESLRTIYTGLFDYAKGDVGVVVTCTEKDVDVDFYGAIRKGCALGNFEKREIVIPGPPKSLTTWARRCE